MSYPTVRFRTAPAMVVAFAERRGAYSGVGDTMRRLQGWLESRGVEAAGEPFCLFYDNPSRTAEADLRSEACIPVKEAITSEGEFGAKVLPETLVAETAHSGPAEEFGRTYGPFLEGLLNQGYDLVGPARECYHAASDIRGPGSGFVIQQPVAKKPRG